MLQPVLAGRVGPVPCRSLPGTPVRRTDATVQGGVLVANVVPASREREGEVRGQFLVEGCFLMAFPLRWPEWTPEQRNRLDSIHTRNSRERERVRENELEREGLIYEKE